MPRTVCCTRQKGVTDTKQRGLLRLVAWQSITQKSYNAFLRRVHRVIEYTENGTKEYDSVQAYFDRDNSFQLVGAHGQGQIPFEEQGADV